MLGDRVEIRTGDYALEVGLVVRYVGTVDVEIELEEGRMVVEDRANLSIRAWAGLGL
jgi:hypothetical protein